MPVMARIIALALGAALLSGCFQAELGGPVMAADVTVTNLRTGALVQDNIVTVDPQSQIEAKGQDKWDALNDVGKLINLGNFTIDRSLYDDNILYLVTVTGGEDADLNHDRVINANPAAVRGEWHVIASGADLKAGGGKVSLLTEAVYRGVLEQLPQLTDSELLVRLDQVTRTIITDTNEDGEVNYADLLNWTILFHIDNYQLDFANVDSLRDAIAAGRPESAVNDIALRVIGEEPLDAQGFFNQNISAQIVQARCISCHVSGGVASTTRLVFVQTSVESYRVRNHNQFVELGLSRGDLLGYVVGKARGQGHGGGTQLRDGDPKLDDLRSYLRMID